MTLVSQKEHGEGRGEGRSTNTLCGTKKQTREKRKEEREKKKTFVIEVAHRIAPHSDLHPAAVHILLGQLTCTHCILSTQCDPYTCPQAPRSLGVAAALRTSDTRWPLPPFYCDWCQFTVIYVCIAC
jgi:hypothetical protein